MIAYAARDSVVVAGDLLASGTTGGGGCLAELWGRNGVADPAAARGRATWCGSRSEALGTPCLAGSAHLSLLAEHPHAQAGHHQRRQDRGISWANQPSAV